MDMENMDNIILPLEKCLLWNAATTERKGRHEAKAKVIQASQEPPLCSAGAPARDLKAPSSLERLVGDLHPIRP